MEWIRSYNKLVQCRQHAEVIQNHENEHVRGTGQGKARHRKYNGLKLGCGHAYDLYIVNKEEFSITCYICDTYI
jgi:hypothetical protein